MSIAIATLVGALTFGAVFVMLTTRRRLAIQRQLGPYVGAVAASRQTARGANRAAELFERLLERLGLKERLALALDRAGLDTTPGAFSALVSLTTVTLFCLVLVAAGSGKAIFTAVATPVVAYAVLLVRAYRRSRAFEAQLPEILDLLSSSLKAGHGFQHALQNLANDIGDPAGSEFRRVIAEVHLGRTLESALADLGERIRSEDLVFVLDAITVQRQVGGSLAELFELVAETVRSREQFRRKLRAITGMVRMSARVLTAMPLVAAILLTLVNHSYMAPLWSSNAGHVMLAVTIMMVLIGGSILRRIGSVKP